MDAREIREWASPNPALIPPTVLVNQNVSGNVCPAKTFQQPWWQEFPGDPSKNICSCGFDCLFNNCQWSDPEFDHGSNQAREKCLEQFIQAGWTKDVNKRKHVAQGMYQYRYR